MSASQMPLHGTCATCPFWNGPVAQGNPQGECRESAPRLFMFAIPQPQNRAVLMAQGQEPSAAIGMAAQTAWPVTVESAWCGMHPDRQPPEVLDGE